MSGRCRREPLAELRNVSVLLDERVVLSNVSFSLWAGELVFVRGPNGSGKTTAMLALAGALDTNIVVGERLIQPGTQFGFIFQDTALQFAAASAAGELALTRTARGLKTAALLADVRDREALAWATVGGEEDPADLHPSVQKLLALVAMTEGANVVIVDEPSVGVGDWALEKLLAALILQRDQGKCVVIVSHEERLEVLADRVLEFRDGSVSVVVPLDGERVCQNETSSTAG